MKWKLKIEENVDLNELEKFGFKFNGNKFYIKREADCFDFTRLEIDKNTREIHCFNNEGKEVRILHRKTNSWLRGIITALTLNGMLVTIVFE